MFAFGLWDRSERTLYLARDRFGEKPLYIGRAGSDVVFASELKSLCVDPAFDRTLFPRAVRAFLAYGYVPAPWTIYAQAWKVAPAKILPLRAAQVYGIDSGTLPALGRKYWSAPAVMTQCASEAAGLIDTAAEELLETTLKEAVGDQMVADVPSGAFLSGGIDSSLIVALMQAESRTGK